MKIDMFLLIGRDCDIPFLMSLDSCECCCSPEVRGDTTETDHDLPKSRPGPLQTHEVSKVNTFRNQIL